LRTAGTWDFSGWLGCWIYWWLDVRTTTATVVKIINWWCSGSSSGSFTFGYFFVKLIELSFNLFLSPLIGVDSYRRLISLEDIVRIEATSATIELGYFFRVFDYILFASILTAGA
jgi:hypothetical protein